MIAYLKGKLIEKRDTAVVVDVQGVGYEVFCSTRTLSHLGENGTPTQLFVHTQYRSDGASLFGFGSVAEKTLFLSLIKVDSVGPKSALNIMSAAPWDEIAHLIEDGDVSALSKLPKISKKTAEHVVVKLKGKLGELFLLTQSADTLSSPKLQERRTKTTELRRMRQEAQSALAHLGFKPQDVERALSEIKDDVWQGDLQAVIRHALNDLSGNN